MNPASLTVKQKIANGFVIFTAIWSSAIMPVIPSYAKMLDNNDLPTLGSDNIIAEDNTERLVAEYSKTLGTFLSQKKKTKDLSDMAQNYARNKATNEATKEIESWLSKAGNAKLSINLDKKLSVKNSQLDWLIPWYDQPDTLLFTQHSVHRNDGRLQTNNGIGLRRFYEKNTLGINAFIDHDLSQYHTRAGVGVEYWQDYLKVNANTYFALSSWKSTSELNHDFNAKPANGWDIQAEGWLPAYPHLGGNLKYEQYYGDSVALFGKTKRQKNPKAATIGAHWTPFPLLTLNANHKIGSQGKKETQAKIQFTWTLGKSLAHHLDPTKVADARRLSGNRYDFVERNNNIILDYQKKTLLHLSLPAKIQGETGQAISLVKSFSSKYPLKQIEWQAPELLAAGGSISSTDQTATVILPTYKTANTAEAAQKLNRYRLQGTAFDTKGNASPVAETLIEITNAGVISISPNDIKFQGKGLANGNDVNSINVVVKDSHGNVVPNAKVVFILPNALTLAANKTKTGAATQSEFQRELRKKMQAMKVAKPWEYTATTNSKGEAQVQFTSQTAGTYEVGAYTGSHQPVKAQVVFKSDIKQAYVRSLTIQKTGAVADGISKNLAKVYVTDTNGNRISGQEVKLTATNATLVAPEVTNEQGEIDIVLTSLKTGLSEITATINGKSETASVYFINDKLAEISITNISKALAGEEGVITLKLTNADAQITTRASWTKVPSTVGTYSTSVQLDKVMDHTLIAKVNGQTKTTRIHVNPLKGFDNVTAVSLQTPSTTEVDEKNKLTLTLTDRFGNGVVEVKPSHITLTSGSVAQVVTWTEGKNGVYRTELALSQVGNQSITVKVNNATETKAVRVNSPAGKDNVASIQLTATTTSVLPNTPVTLTLTLKDQHGNSVKNVRSSDISLSDSHISESFTSPNWAEDSQQIGVYTVVVNLKKTAEHTLTAKVNNLEKGTKITVQPFTGVQQVNRVELSIDKNAISIGGKVNFTLTAKDIYGNNVLIQATDIRLQNANGAINQPTWQQHGMQFKGELSLSISGNYVITAKVGAQTSSPISLTVQSGKPVFVAGKSEFSVSSHEIDEGSNANITVELVLKDASGNPILGKRPRVSASAGTIANTMQENSNGVYTSTFKNDAIGKSNLTLDSASIDYNDTVPPITVITYGTSEIIAQSHSFSMSDGFPNTGFKGAKFQITVPIGQPTDYDWSVDIDWLSIDNKGVVTMQHKPIPIRNGNAMIPIFKGVPKPHTGYKRTIDYRFTLKKWYDNHGKMGAFASRNTCTAPSRLIKYKDLSIGNSHKRQVGEQVFQEWEAKFTLDHLGARHFFWTADTQTSTTNSIYNPYSAGDQPIDISNSQSLDAICVNDLN